MINRLQQLTEATSVITSLKESVVLDRLISMLLHQLNI